MKKRVLIILLAVVFCLSLVMVVACNQTHTCESKCSDCGLCTNKDCKEDACKDKCKGHDAPTTHTCGHVCLTCGGCTDATCTDAVCATKCTCHGSDTVNVTGIIVNGLDEDANNDNDGTLAKPYVVIITQGHDIELSINVRPANATDKTVDVNVGKIEDNAFVVTPDVTGLTATINNTRLTLSTDEDLTAGEGIVVEIKAKDGSDVAIYLSVVVNEYVTVSQITSSTLKASEEEGFDYELLTAVGTNWNMSKGITSRGQAILDGDIDGKTNLQVPTSLLYYPNINNLGLSVLPNNASEKDYTITYSENGIVEVASDGALTVKKAGETVITITSDSNKDVSIKVKVTVADTLYRGLLKSAYTDAPDAENVSGGWDFDTQHASEAQLSRFNDWHMVLVHSNLTDSDIANPGSATSAGWDRGQKIFYDGDPDRPYGIAIENHVLASSGANLLESTGMMWAKLTIPTGAITFNIKMQATGSGKDYSEYRVVFVPEEGEAVVMTDGWMKTPVNDTNVKVTVPEAIKGQKGALIVEARVTKANESVEFHAKVMKFEGQVDVTGVVYNKDTAEFMVGERVIDNITASVRPDNATNDEVTYAMHDEDADKGVTVDANTGVITISADAVAGTYRVIATSVADNTKTATLTITLREDEVVVNKWDGKTDIINGVADVKWNVIGNIDDGVGEGADINCNGGRDWSALSLSNRVIKSDAYILTFGARVFHRNGETYPHFIVKVIEDGEEAVVIRGVGQENDYVYIDTDARQYCSYDLTAYIGKTVEIQIGIDRGTHAVVQYIEFGSLVEVTEVSFNKSAESYPVGERVINGFTAAVTPDKSTNNKITYAIHEEDADKGVTVDAKTGVITVSETAAAGEYRIIATSAMDNTKTAMFTLTLTEQEVEVNEWDSSNGDKNEIIGGVSGIAWVKDGEGLDSLNEGESIQRAESVLKLEDRKIKATSFIMSIRIRCFGGTTSEIVLKVIDGDDTYEIPTIGGQQAIPQDKGEGDWYSYDLSAFIGKTVTLTLGVKEDNDRAVVQHIKFVGSETDIVAWANKNALIDVNGDPWTVEGQWNSGPSEGIDLQGEGSYASNTFVIGAYNAKLTIGAKIFANQEGDKGYPDIKLVVICDGEETVVKAIGHDSDTITIDHDPVQQYSYDLSEFIGEEVEIRIVCVKEVNHCVIANAELTNMDVVEATPEA